MPKRNRRRSKDVQLELDLADHTYRLKRLPSKNLEWIRQALVWLLGAVLLLAFVWLSITP